MQNKIKPIAAAQTSAEELERPALGGIRLPTSANIPRGFDSPSLPFLASHSKMPRQPELWGHISKIWFENLPNKLKSCTTCKKQTCEEIVVPSVSCNTSKQILAIGCGWKSIQERSGIGMNYARKDNFMNFAIQLWFMICLGPGSWAITSHSIPNPIPAKL